MLALVFTGRDLRRARLRWQYLLAPIGPTHFITAFRTTVIGFAATFLLPARAGEVIRPYLLARREGLNATAAFATIILERLLDLITVLLLFACFVLIAAPGDVTGDPAQFARVKLRRPGSGRRRRWPVRRCSSCWRGTLNAWAGWRCSIERVLPARLAQIVARFVETFSQGLAVMRQPRRMLIALALSVPLWLAIASGIWLTSQAFHITFPFRASFLVMTVLVVGVAVPTPGAVGGFHLAYQFAAATFFGAPPDRAAGAAIVLHAISFVPVTLLGIFFMAREGLTLAGPGAWRRAASCSGATREAQTRSRRRRTAEEREPDADTPPPAVRQAEGRAR